MVPPNQSTSSSSTTPTPNNFNGCYDPLDVDSFINYDQLRCSSPSVSPTTLRAQPSGQTTSAMANSNNTLLPPQNSSVMGPFSPQSFSGPSHQYDLHKQQTGIPLGALASTLAVNQASNLNMVRTQSGFGMSTDDSFFGTSPAIDEFVDFNSASQHHPSVSGTSDMDMEYDGGASEDLPAFFFPEKSTSSTTQFVNPSAIGGQEQQSTPARTATSQGNAMGRLYPGVHSQQAAKARQQQQQAPQKPLPQGRGAAHHSTDPIVEERISRLLNSMRQSSVTTSSDDDANALSANGVHGHIARMRKEEEDMDEDERLLASEQGKKLSSKERRQLRNKVSARAFRSRRKEYIGQLEGEVAVRTNEANDLRAENRALRDENTRLSDLTRMLLSSSAFSTFLDDLSISGMRPPPTTEQAPAPAAAPRSSENIQPNTRKDANPVAVAQQLHAQQQNTTQVGMTLLPESAMDFSALDLDGSNSWAAGSMGPGAWGNTTSRVFSVMELPQGPAVDQIDSGVLSGKSSNVVGGSFSAAENKTEVPVVERMPVVQAQDTTATSNAIVDDSVEYDESDPAFALFANSPDKPSAPADGEGSDETFCGIAPEKLFSRVDLVSRAEELDDDGEVSSHAMDRFHSMCESMEAAMQRIDRMTSHL